MLDKTPTTRPDAGKARGRRRLLALASVALAGGLAAAPLFGGIHAAPAPIPIGPASFADVAQKVKPAVVNISTTRKGAAPGGREHASPGFPPGSPFEEFFRRYFDRQADEGARRTPRAEIRALGSGFIIDPAGYVVTNNHVIEGADTITVVLDDGTRLAADVRGRDPKTDLALLKVEAAEPLAHVSFGDSDAMRVGDWVVAVGNPFGLGGTVTAGIISARGRDLKSGPFDDFLQVDAPINRGNSGGPLFDGAGRVIGINTAIYSPSGGNVGIGFAIPSALAEPIIAELRADGRVERGWLGVRIQPVTEDIADGLGLAGKGGALVAGVEPDSPAAKAGLRPGDVIRGVDGHAVTRLGDLPRLVAGVRSGETARIEVWRHGSERTVEVTIGSVPAGDVMASGRTEDHGQPALGLSLASLTDEVRRRFGLADDARGVVVVAVEAGSAAAERGLRPGDVVVMAGQDPVAAPADVVRAVDSAAAAKRRSVVLLVSRRGEERFVALPLKRA